MNRTAVKGSTPRPRSSTTERAMRTALILALLIHSFPSAIAADPPSDPRQYLDWWYRQPAVKLLLKHGGKESLAAAVRLFENKDLMQVISSSGRAEVLQRFVAAGRTEPYRFYRERLDDEKSAERFAVEITTEFAKDDADVKKIVANHPKTADQIPHLKTWLEAKLGKKG